VNNWVDLDTPFLKRFRSLNIGDLRIQPATLAAAVGGVVAVLLIAHGFGMKATGRTKGGADFESERSWDRKHPDAAIGAAKAADVAAAVEEAANVGAEGAESAEGVSSADNTNSAESAEGGEEK
jgi:hydrogenase small subunit